MRQRRPTADSYSEALSPALIIHFTRLWLHYGTITFVVFCSIVAALRGLSERW